MKRLILSTINRAELYKKNYEADSRSVMQKGDDKEDIEEFYEPLAKILTLIYRMK